MSSITRLALVAATAVVTTFVLTMVGSSAAPHAGAAPAAAGKGGGPGPLPPGDYRFTQSRAGASVGGGAGPNLDIFVTHVVNVSRPTNGPVTLTDETDLFIDTVNQGVFLGGCFIVPAADFTISKDIQSASLHATVDPSTPMCPGPSPTFPFAQPIQIDATWTGIGVMTTGRDDNSSRCLSSSTDSKTSSSDANATATVTATGVAFLSGPATTSQAGLHSTDTAIEVKGVPAAACIPGPF